MYYQIKTVSELKKFQAGKETFMLWPPHLISSRRHCLWMGDCSVIPQRQTPVTSGQYQYFIGSQKKHSVLIQPKRGGDGYINRPTKLIDLNRKFNNINNYVAVAEIIMIITFSYFAQCL